LLEEPDPSVHLQAVRDSPCHKAAKDLSAHLRKAVASTSTHPRAGEVFQGPVREEAVAAVLAAEVASAKTGFKDKLLFL